MVKRILNEYATDDFSLFTSIGGKTGTSGNGKKADNIATGQAKQYKDDTYLTYYEKQLPNLAKITQNLKTNQPDSAIEVLGPALEELLILIRAKRPLKKDEKNEWILPMGDNIRMVQNGKRFMLKYVGLKDRKDNNPDPNAPEKNDKEITQAK